MDSEERVHVHSLQLDSLLHCNSAIIRGDDQAQLLRTFSMTKRAPG